MKYSTQSLATVLLVLCLSSCSNDFDYPADKNNTVGGYSMVNTFNNTIEASCKNSTSGKCYFVFFIDGCATLNPDKKTTIKTCTTTLVEEFSISIAEKKRFNKPVEDVKYCVNYNALPVAPSCFK